MFKNSINSYNTTYMFYNVYKQLLSVYMIIYFYVLLFFENYFYLLLNNCAIKSKRKEKY
jgi:hypothetical protein